MQLLSNIVQLKSIRKKDYLNINLNFKDVLIGMVLLEE